MTIFSTALIVGVIAIVLFAVLFVLFHKKMSAVESSVSDRIHSVRSDVSAAVGQVKNDVSGVRATVEGHGKQLAAHESRLNAGHAAASATEKK